MAVKKKLIEVALPLDDINAASAREKSIRHGHPSTLHLWWARRPLAAARAVIWSSLVDDPSAHPEEFPTVEEQAVERERLFGILRELVVWENSNNDRVLNAAKAEIKKSMGDDLPPLLDPFAGGGAIPLEAQRLGLKAYAQDLNPVAVTINKAMIEIPPLFADKPAVNPGARDKLINGGWSGNAGLAADVEYYGAWMKEEARRRIGDLYPKAQLPADQGGGEAAVIAWLWTRTVRCPNPACKHEAILVRSFDLSKKRGNEWHVEPCCVDGEVRFAVKPGKAMREGTVNRRGATCVHCGAPIGFEYIRRESREGRMGTRLMSVVAEGKSTRVYLPPDDSQVNAAIVGKTDNAPSGALLGKAKVNVGLYGMNNVSDLFSNRQLLMTTTLYSLIDEVREAVARDCAAACAFSSDELLEESGRNGAGAGAGAYADAVALYLSFAIDKCIDRGTTVCCWDSGYQKIGNTFGRQAIPMRWTFAESNPIGDSTGALSGAIKWVSEAIKALPRFEHSGEAVQFDAQSDNGKRGLVISTDPPYYDNIDYADLSDFFYVWLRQSLKSVFPQMYSTIQTPKTEELVATPYRFGSKKEAMLHFESGMGQALKSMYHEATDDVPVTIYYGYKQSEAIKTEEGFAVSSTGWETMLQSIIKAGFSITGTWPIRTELTTALKASMNALASSIVLVCRKRPEDAPMGTRRDFVMALKRELGPALDKLRSSNIAPVDLAQSAIGPGIGVYSRYSQVLEADGSPMTVRAALQLINQEVDAYFSDQDGELDRESRFCVDLYTQKAFDTIKFGEADVLARAKNVSIEGLAAQGLLASVKGSVHLLDRGEVSEHVDFKAPTWLTTQQLTRALEEGGVTACAKIVSQTLGGRADGAKALAYRLFTIADKRNWQQEAFAYNSLVTAWPEIQSKAAQLAVERPTQDSLFD